MKQFYRPLFRLFRNKTYHTLDQYNFIEALLWERLFEKCTYIKHTPDVILHMGISHTGLLKEIKAEYPHALCIASDPAKNRLTPPFSLCQDSEHLAIKPNSVDMIIMHQLLLWSDDPLRCFKEMYTLLKPGGLLLFSTMGPSTLQELRHASLQASQLDRVHIFYDMHDLGDMLHECQYDNAVMDADSLTLTYSNTQRLCLDLSKSGLSYCHSDRPRTLMGKQAWQSMLTAYHQAFEQPDGSIPATFELLYGQAFKPLKTHAAQEAQQGVVQMTQALSDIPRRKSN